MTRALALAGTLAVAATAAAEPVTLRLASAAPDGTAWARELRAFSRDVATSTQGQVQIKWYLSGIAGDELQMAARVKRDQLDGIMSAGFVCQSEAPSLRITGLAALFRDRDEARYVTARLRPVAAEEMARDGWYLVGTAGLGFTVVFSKAPVRSMADLARLHPWVWDIDETIRAQLGALGLPIVPTPIYAAARAYDDGRLDGFITLPSAALAFQWSTQVHYVTDLRVGYLSGCMMVARRAWDLLSHEDQQAVLAAAGKLEIRVEDDGAQNDRLLLGGLLARQGLKALPASPAFQAEFDAAATRAQAAAAKLAPPGTLERVGAWLADYRAHHAAARDGGRR